MTASIEAVRVEVTWRVRHVVLHPGEPVGAEQRRLDRHPLAAHHAAFVDHAVVAVASVAPTGEDDLWSCYAVAVEAPFRGRGLGRALVERCVDHATRHGATEVRCTDTTSDTHLGSESTDGGAGQEGRS